MEVFTSLLWAALGVALFLAVYDSAIRTFILPRAEAPILTRAVFIAVRTAFNAMTRPCRTYEGRDHIMAFYAPIGLLVLPAVWLVLVILGAAAIFHALDVRGFQRAFEMSGSSVFTLGFVRPPGLATTVVAFVEAATGVLVLALLVSYLPTIYGAFSRREVLVAQLSARGGDPPSGVGILTGAQRMERFELLDDLWVAWQGWFAEVEETHTSLGVLSFFRSPSPDRSWITAAGAVLDGAALRESAVDRGFSAEAGLCIRSGFFALRAVAEYFDIALDAAPTATEPISVTEDEFLGACDELAAAGIPVRADRAEAWQQFRGWRVNYDRALVGLAGFVMAPYAPWSSDRSLRYRRPRVYRRRPRVEA